MARPKLQRAMRAKGYTPQTFANELNINRCTVFAWITGETKRIRSFYVPKICDTLGLVLDDLDDEPLAPISSIDENESSEEEYEVPNLDSEEHMEISRRDASYTFLKAAGFAFLPGSTTTLSGPVIGPDEYLAQAEDAIDTCWTSINQSNFAKVERTLSLHVPILTQFANTQSEHQQESAEFAVQAMILQMMLAHHRMDYAARKKFGADAVRFGRISGNPLYLATALDLHGNTFINCYQQPLKAIGLFNEALRELGSDASLNRSSLYSQLSFAYAQIKDKMHAKENEKLSRDYAKLARETMPVHPELDPLYRVIRMGTAELDQFEARIYLLFARRFSNDDYGEWAYNLFNDALEKVAMSLGYRNQALVRRADASIIQNKMHEFVESLRSGFDIAVHNNHQSSLSLIHEVVSHIPQKWQKETSIQTLQSDISQLSPVIARR